MDRFDSVICGQNRFKIGVYPVYHSTIVKPKCATRKFSCICIGNEANLIGESRLYQVTAHTEHKSGNKIYDISLN